MECARAQSRGRGWPLGIMLAGLALWLFAAPRGRGGAIGVLRHRPGIRSMPRTSRGWPQPGSGRTASCSAGGRSSRRQGSFDWAPADRLRRRPRLARNPAGPVRVGIADLGGQRRHRASPDRQRGRPGRRGRTSSRRRWRATGPAAATGRNGYRQRYGASATPLPIQSWQIWNEPNLKKYFAPGRPSTIGPEVRPSCCRSPTTRSRAGIRRPRSSSPGMPGYGDSNGLGLPRQPLRGARGQGATSTSPPCTRTRATSTSSAARSSSSAP